MKLRELDTSDVFYWKGNKYSIFFKIKNEPSKAYKITCLNWPNPSECIEMPCNRIVKPVIRVKD